MTERYTGAFARGVRKHPFLAVTDYGRRTRVEMLRQFRDHYADQLAEAQEALSLKDEDIETETYLGSVVMRNRELVK